MSKANIQSYRDQYNNRVSKYFLWGLWLHLPLFYGMSVYLGKGFWPVALISVLTLMLPTWGLLRSWNSTWLSGLVGFSALTFSGLLIHLGGGMIEMHFHVFMSLALLLGYGLFTPLLVGAGTIAIHHISFFFFLPQSLFNYEASFWIVILHALFVVAQTGTTLVFARLLGHFIQLQDSVVGRLNLISQTTATNISGLEEASSALSSAATETSSSLEKTKEALNNLAHVVEGNSNYSSEAYKIAQKSKDVANKGSQDIRSLIESMHSVSASSKQMKEILGVIDDIAFQTNLLALNAAVEAARAGEQGRGFAVVADAVRELAQRSANSAKDIGKLVVENEQTVMGGQMIADASGKVLEEILESIHRVTELNQHIEQTAQTQNHAIEAIRTAFSEIDSGARQVAMYADRLSKSSGDMNGDSKDLVSLVGKLTDKKAA